MSSYQVLSRILDVYYSEVAKNEPKADQLESTVDLQKKLSDLFSSAAELSFQQREILVRAILNPQRYKLELEIRLGSWQENSSPRKDNEELHKHHENGISAADWITLVNYLNLSNCWSQKSFDVLYRYRTFEEDLQKKHPVVRSENWFRSEFSLLGTRSQENLRKHQIYSLVLDLSSGFSCKLSLAFEEILFESNVFPSRNESTNVERIHTKDVRLKETFFFVYQSEIHSNLIPWSYELSRVFQGVSRSECARKRFDETVDSFEVEIECLAPGIYREERSADLLLQSLILKLDDLVRVLASTSSVSV